MRTDRHGRHDELTVAFRDFANAPKNNLKWTQTKSVPRTEHTHCLSYKTLPVGTKYILTLDLVLRWISGRQAMSTVAHRVPPELLY